MPPARDGKTGFDISSPFSAWESYSFTRPILLNSFHCLPDITRNDKMEEHGPLAQLAEQVTLNQQVTGSIPVRLTIFEANSTHFRNR